MAQTAIEWTHRRLPDGTLLPGYTFNVVHGCTKVSPGCKHCYAEAITLRYGQRLWGPNALRRTMSPKYWASPLGWNREAEASGHARLVFCSSMADVFESHPTVNQERQKLWPLIERTPWLTWLLLTKRPQNILSMVPISWLWPSNVWVGTSVENQRCADERISALLQVPSVVRFLSCEPLLGPINLSAYLPHLQWCIAGGESGSHARPIDLAWVRSIRDQCQAAHVPFFFKQWGGRFHSTGGRSLDGRTWGEMPDVVEGGCYGP